MDQASALLGGVGRPGPGGESYRMVGQFCGFREIPEETPEGMIPQTGGKDSKCGHLLLSLENVLTSLALQGVACTAGLCDSWFL